MKFGVFNIREDLSKYLETLFDIYDLEEDHDVDCIFIDWVPPESYGFVRQAEIVENYVRKKTPTIVFDRHLSMTYKEYVWLKRFAVFFFEPAINHRIGFTYIPQWTTPLEENWQRRYVGAERSVDLFCMEDLNNKVKSFEKYYKEYASLNPDKNVVSIVPFKKDYENYNINYAKEDLKYTDIKYMVLIGSVTDYRVGYLPDQVFNCMKGGILPMLPVEHRFFGSMFRHLVVENERDIDYFISLIRDGVRYAMIEDIFENMEEYHPEFKIDYVLEKIKFYLKV